jgi:hypothetical protein
VEPPHDRVHRPLVVADAGLELERDPLEHDPALRSFRGDLHEPPAPEERAQDGLLVLGRRAERQAGLARRSDLFGRPPQGLGVQAVGRAVVVEPHDPRRRQPVQVPSDPIDRQLEALRQRCRRRRRPRERPGDRQALRIGERAQDLLGRLGHVGG